MQENQFKKKNFNPFPSKNGYKFHNNIDLNMQHTQESLINNSSSYNYYSNHHYNGSISNQNNKSGMMEFHWNYNEETQFYVPNLDFRVKEKETMREVLGKVGLIFENHVLDNLRLNKAGKSL